MNLIVAPACTAAFLVGDAQCGQIQDLLRGSKTPVLALGSQTSALAEISAGLLQQREAGHPVATLHLIAHGRAGAFRIGEQWIDAEALKAHASDLARWGVETIALWSCHVGADADFVALLEELTGAQVVASAGWLGRDDEGVEQLQLGAWNLADLLAPETWPAAFRLAVTVSINAVDGTGICAEDELLFQAGGNANGYVAVDFTLGDSNLPAGSQVWFSLTGEEGSWGLEPKYTSGDLTQLSESGQGYFKVKLPDDTAKGSQLNAAIKQFDIQLDLDNPIIDIQYNVLHFDEAVELEGLPPIANEWTDQAEGKQIENAYTYTNLLPEINELGFKLEADVSLKFNTFLKRFTLDTDQQLEYTEDFDYKNRFQPRFGEKDDTQQSAQDVSFEFEFYLLDEQKETRTKVSLKNFWVDVVDLDTVMKNPNHEFVSIPSLGLASNEDESASAAVIYTLPAGAGNTGEKGLDPDNPGQNTDGFKNLIEVEIDENEGYTKFLGSPEWNVFHDEDNKQKFSNHPAGSVLLDYRDPVQNLTFNAGTTGKMHTGGGSGEGSGGTIRNLSFSIGNSLTLGDGFKPSGEIQQDSASIILEDCFDFFITPAAACENVETEPLTDASFTFNVTGGKEGSPPDSLKGTYTYELTANDERVGSKYAGYSYRIEDANGNQLDGNQVVVDPSGVGGEGKGTLAVNADITEFRVVFDVGSLALGDQLVGDESVTLKLTHEKGAEDEKTASLKDPALGCDPVNSEQASAFTIKAVAACENENTELLTDASFTFSVKGVNPGGNSLDSLKGTYTYVLTANGERVGSSYAGYSYRIEDANGQPLDGNQVVVNPSGGGEGTLVVNTDITEFRVVFDVGAVAFGDQLVGDEELQLELTRADTNFSATDKAALDNKDLACGPVNSEVISSFRVVASAACLKEDDAPSSASTDDQLFTDASFTFDVIADNIDPVNRGDESLRGTYEYVIDAAGQQASAEFANYSYRIEDVNGKRIDDKAVIVAPDGDGRGTLSVNKDIGFFRVVFDVETANEGEQLGGDEEVALTLTRVEDSKTDTDKASLADENLDCDPIQPEQPQDIFLKAVAACVKDGVLSNSTAEFVFDVTLDPASASPKELLYSLTPSGLSDEDYAINVQLSDGVNLKDGGTDGVLALDGGVDSFSITITATADDVLSGDETLALSLTDVDEVVSATASLAELDCPPASDDLGKTDVALYLLMDNSTSMLQSDPSTASAGQSNRLESQDRVSLFAYQQALEKAGYGFSRKGESGVLSEAEFKDAVINNSSADLAKVLDDFEVIVDPNNSGEAQDLTLHLISYGYAVDYGSVTITADDPSAGKRAAEAIIGLQTPDQIYGNSIDGNALWTERGLPNPTSNDTFWGEGRPASNLYSGTEMLGALEGLENLLAAQLDRADTDPITTYINMTTDGRPERRAWWDTRTGAGSDSLTGQSVPLPGSLGGDLITTSGLVYDNAGEANFLNNNEGELQWIEMQNRLNATLDAIAAQQADSSNPLQVSVLGMGDGSDANFPAIYSDLFGLRTFNNSGGGWIYDFFTSYALPDFIG